MAWFGSPCCCGCVWNSWDRTLNTPATFYTQNTILAGGASWSQTGPGLGNYITYYDPTVAGQLMLGGSADTFEYSVQVTMNSFPDGDVLRIWMACGDTPSGFYVEFRSGPSGYVHVEGDEAHQIDFPFSFASGSVFGACIQQEPTTGVYFLSAFASTNIILDGRITPANKGAILQFSTSLGVQIANLLCQDRYDPTTNAVCETCINDCGCGDACTVDVTISGVRYTGDPDDEFADFCNGVNQTYTLATMKGGFNGTLLSEYDSPAHCFWIYLFDCYFWVWFDMTYDPSTGITTYVGSLHITESYYPPCCPTCCAFGLPITAGDKCFCDCSSWYFKTTIYTDGGPQNCASLTELDLTSDTGNPLNLVGSCCDLSEAAFTVVGLSSANCTDLVYYVSYSCEVTVTLDWEGVDGDGNATIDYDLYLSDSNGSLCWYGNPTSGPWILNHDANCEDMATGGMSNPPETISGSIYNLPDSAHPLTLKVWYNLCSVCDADDSDIEPTVKQIVITNTGNQPINVGGGAIAPGGTLVISSFALDSGACGDSTFAGGTAITIYGPA